MDVNVLIWGILVSSITSESFYLRFQSKHHSTEPHKTCTNSDILQRIPSVSLLVFEAVFRVCLQTIKHSLKLFCQDQEVLPPVEVQMQANMCVWLKQAVKSYKVPVWDLNTAEMGFSIPLYLSPDPNLRCCSTWATTWTSSACWWDPAATIRTMRPLSRAGTSSTGCGGRGLRARLCRTAGTRCPRPRQWWDKGTFSRRTAIVAHTHTNL